MEKNNKEIAPAQQIDRGLIEQLVLNNDLSKLTSEQRVNYYMKVCESLGLNHLTQPFGLIAFEGKVSMYAKRDATDQLRKTHGVSITDIRTKKEDGLYIVTAAGKDRNGREDVSTGIVPLTVEQRVWDQGLKGGNGGWSYTGKTVDLSGKDLANAIMKAETKAKRRLTLSLIGLGITDESELDTMQGVEAGTFEQPPGDQPEIIDEETLQQWQQVVNACTTPEEVDAAAVSNKDAISNSKTLRKMFNLKKSELKGNSSKARAQRSEETVAEMFKKQGDKEQ